MARRNGDTGKLMVNSETFQDSDLRPQGGEHPPGRDSLVGVLNVDGIFVLKGERGPRCGESTPRTGGHHAVDPALA